MTTTEFTWTDDSLTAEDKNLISAYEHIGRPLDDLAYTKAFDGLLKQAYSLDATNITDDCRHNAFRRLLNLRKRGRLPRLVHSSS